MVTALTFLFPSKKSKLSMSMSDNPAPNLPFFMSAMFFRS
uniref:Uncharacterized protein n=1 Tax=Lepeophtheirus salmonis TaxID=72036 RepID=A0A0K2TNG4_LEPSM